jgi:hypothetical protein
VVVFEGLGVVGLLLAKSRHCKTTSNLELDSSLLDHPCGACKHALENLFQELFNEYKGSLREELCWTLHLFPQAGS